MATEVLLPKIGFEMSEGTVGEWLVPEGGQVAEGQPLLSIESDKSTNEVEAPGSGILRILVPQGETRAVGTVLAVIE